MQKPGKTKRPRGRTLAQAIVGFAILCGVLLVVSSSSTTRRSAAQDTALESTLDSLESANQALDANNYGELRRHLQRARFLVTEAIAKRRQ